MSRVWKFGNNVSTDAITPGTKNLSNNLKDICFCFERPEFREEVQEGDFIVAGESFGCGSSRETAVLAIKESGVKAVLATSFARIFRKNATNIGLHTLVISEDMLNALTDCDEISLDVKTGKISFKNKEYLARVQGKKSLEIIEAGGLIPFLKERNWSYNV